MPDDVIDDYVSEVDSTPPWPRKASLKDSKLVRRIVNAVILANTAALADQYVAEILSEVSAPLSPANRDLIDEQLDALFGKEFNTPDSPAPAPLEELDKHDCYQSLVSMGSTDDNGRKRYQNECWLRCTKCGAQYAKSVVDASIDRSEAVSALSPQAPTSP